MLRSLVLLAPLSASCVSNQTPQSTPDGSDTSEVANREDRDVPNNPPADVPRDAMDVGMRPGDVPDPIESDAQMPMDARVAMDAQAAMDASSPDPRMGDACSIRGEAGMVATCANDASYCTADAGDQRAPFVLEGMAADMNCGTLLRPHLGEPCIQPGYNCTTNTISYAYNVYCPANCPRVWTASAIGGPLAPPELAIG